VEPTHLGRLFLAGAEEILQSARDLQREIDLPRGLEIGSSVGPADLHMGTTEGRLSHGYPRLNIYLEVNDYAGFTHLLQSLAYETCQTAPKQEQGKGARGPGLRLHKGQKYANPAGQVFLPIFTCSQHGLHPATCHFTKNT
jgi:hypothetical protein